MSEEVLYLVLVVQKGSIRGLVTKGGRRENENEDKGG